MNQIPSPVEIAVNAFVRAWTERDPTLRAKLVESCFAESGRMVTRGREIRGRAALLDEMTRMHADPRLVSVRLGSAIDARGTTFRYRGVAEFSDGTSAEAFDAGEIDGDGRISLVLTFAGPLGELES